MGWLGAAIGAVGGMISGNMSNNAASAAAAQANAWNVENYKHRYQWALQDMREAGLNPILAATNGIGGNVNGAAALSSNYDIGSAAAAGSQAESSSQNAKTAEQNAKTAEKQWETYNKKVISDIELNTSSAKKLEADANRIIFETGRDKELLPYAIETAKNNAINSAKQGQLYDAQITAAVAAANNSNSAAAYYGNLSEGALLDNEMKQNQVSTMHDTGINPTNPPHIQIYQGVKHWMKDKASHYENGDYSFFGGD